MRRMKVYDADGKCVEAYNKSIGKYQAYKVGDEITNMAAQVRYLNAAGYYVKGQTTSKGVKIK